MLSLFIQWIDRNPMSGKTTKGTPTMLRRRITFQ